MKSLLRKYSGLLKLASILLILPLGAWFLALDKTFGQYRDIRRTEKKCARITVSGITPTISGEYSGTDIITTGDFMSSFLPVMDSLDVGITGYTSYLTVGEETHSIITAEITARGGFRGLCLLLNSIENGQAAVRPVSVKFNKKTIPRTRETYLEMVFYMQQLINKT